MKYGPSTVDTFSTCSICKSCVQIGGPFYSDPIHNQEFVGKMLNRVIYNTEAFGTWERMVGMLVMISEENSEMFYYVVPRMCGILHCENIPFAAFMYNMVNLGLRCYQQGTRLQHLMHSNNL
jgi:tRNA (guanine26-N2/guanine27-N2)-dimethyltransferase